MPRLPDTAVEVTSVAANLPPGASQQLYLGEQAQEHIVKQLDLSSVQYLLFATHSLLTDEFLKARQYTTSPRQNTPILQGQPAIMLTPTKGLQGGNDFLEDGFLTAAEIMELNLNAELVVLSGGTTAGKTPAAYSSEGFIGLTRAFLYAGARRLLASHWKMETTATRDLVVAMFQELRNQKTPQEALTIAQAELRKSTFMAGGKLHVSRAHPFFWAPFVVVGD